MEENRNEIVTTEENQELEVIESEPEAKNSAAAVVKVLVGVAAVAGAAVLFVKRKKKKAAEAEKKVKEEEYDNFEDDLFDSEVDDESEDQNPYVEQFEKKEN